MSLEVHVLDFHFDEFKENVVAYSEEKGDHFHQNIMKFEHEIFLAVVIKSI